MTTTQIKAGDRIITPVIGGGTGTGLVLSVSDDGQRGLVRWDDLPFVPVHTATEYLVNRTSFGGAEFQPIPYVLSATMAALVSEAR